MPVYKDDKTGKWKALFYYSNYQGERKKKQKRGFNTKKEAQEWEREFLLKNQFSIEMNFWSLYELYLQDIKSRIKETTLRTKQNIIQNNILPFFGKMKVQDIQAIHIRTWQTELLKKELTGVYFKSIFTQLTAIFNYAVKFHNLSKNPCHKAGNFQKKDRKEMKTLSLEQFEKMIQCVEPKECRCFYTIAFWTGMRKGEILALTYQDVDAINMTISITKNLQRVKKTNVIQTPKTPKSTRKIKVNDIVLNCVKEMWDSNFEPEKTDRIFLRSLHSFKAPLDKACIKAGVPKIRIHDLRHSHATYLLSLGVNIVLISQRLGHEKLQTTLNTYCHVSEILEKQLENALNI